MKAEFKTITPEEAKKYLEANVANRNISKNSVHKYARDMAAGKWQENGEPIQIGTNGTLNNGQHRLMAIIEANVPVKMLVVTGIQEDVTMYDTGRKRSNTDLARFDGMESCRANNTYIGSCTFALTVAGGDRTISYMELKRFIEKFGDDMDKSYRIFGTKTGKKGYAKVKVAPLIAAGFFAIQVGYDINKMDVFCNVLQTGLYNDESMVSAIILRNQMLTGDISFSSKQERKRAFYAFEQALRDFDKGYERKKSYYEMKPVYSTLWKGDMDE